MNVKIQKFKIKQNRYQNLKYTFLSIINFFKNSLNESEKTEDDIQNIVYIGGVGDNAKHNSYYAEIIINIDGLPIPGLLRVSNHIANLKTWKEHNEYDFGISLVISDKIDDYNDEDEIDVCIYEYKIGDVEWFVIDEIAKLVGKITSNKLYWNINDNINGISPIKRGSKKLNDLFTNINLSIKKGIEEALKIK